MTPFKKEKSDTKFKWIKVILFAMFLLLFIYIDYIFSSIIFTPIFLVFFWGLGGDTHSHYKFMCTLLITFFLCPQSYCESLYWNKIELNLNKKCDTRCRDRDAYIVYEWQEKMGETRNDKIK